MNKKPLIGIIGFSDGDPEVHEQLKDIVQAQVDVIESELKKDGRIDVIVADCPVASVDAAKEEAEKLRAKGVDGTIFSYVVFSYPNFSAIATKSASTSAPKSPITKAISSIFSEQTFAISSTKRCTIGFPAIGIKGFGVVNV